MSADAAERLAAVRDRINAAAARAGRNPDEITLVGVSKRKSADDIVAAVHAGLRHVGENYIQEARGTIPAVTQTLEDAGVHAPRWHFIGRLQSNKANRAVELFDVIETLDRKSLGEHLNRRAWARERPLDVLRAHPPIAPWIRATFGQGVDGLLRLAPALAPDGPARLKRVGNKLLRGFRPSMGPADSYSEYRGGASARL